MEDMAINGQGDTIKADGMDEWKGNFFSLKILSVHFILYTLIHTDTN